EKYGADIVRLWVSSVDWQNEVPFGEDLFKQITDPYRRLRNTLRILLANLKGYDGSRPAQLAPTDAWILERTNTLIREVRAAYESYEFRKVFMAINQFCTNDLSALYIDMTKDSLYCDAATSPHRLSKQFAISRIFDTLVKLLAPILVYTCDEAWEHAGNAGSVHEQDFPEPCTEFDTGLTAPFARLQQIKSVIQVAIEAQIKAKAFNKNNEAVVSLTIPANEDATVAELLADTEFAKEFFIISDLHLQTGDELAATAEKTTHVMCPRCRRYEPAVNDECLCARCAAVMG
ncbi:MAG: class I tRNA ligase family protein, partial [Akkermansia sp.]|nr:class I tRNA ligase family protein [Akkermansia sp.]